MLPRGVLTKSILPPESASQTLSDSNSDTSGEAAPASADSTNPDSSQSDVAQNDAQIDYMNDEASNFKTDFVEGRSHNSDNIILGDSLIVIAQLITACQMVYEEVYVVKLDIPPLQMVGWEGVFGFSVLSVLLIPLNYIPNIKALKHINSGGTLEDPIDGLIKIGRNGLLFVPIMGLVLSIAFYNFSGISLTKELNATTRMVLDSIRILVVWLFALAVSWQVFHWLQVMKFKRLKILI